MSNNRPPFWGFPETSSVHVYDFENKYSIVRDLVGDMIENTLSMFEYSGQPETIPERNLEMILQCSGFACIAKGNDGKLYAFTGGLGGEPDEYYMPTIVTVANPALNLSKTFKIGTDCIVIPSDKLYRGLMPIHNRYATLLADNIISMRMASINARTQHIISASDDITKKSADKYIADLIAGKFSCIGENAFLDGITVHDSGKSGNSVITQLIEYQQYTLANWYNKLGIEANFNMKREALGTNETEQNKSILLPLIDNMLECREKGVERVNEMFGTNISVKLNSSWEELKKSGQPENDDPEKEDDDNENNGNENAS